MSRGCWQRFPSESGLEASAPWAARYVYSTCMHGQLHGLVVQQKRERRCGDDTVLSVVLSYPYGPCIHAPCRAAPCVHSVLPAHLDCAGGSLSLEAVCISSQVALGRLVEGQGLGAAAHHLHSEAGAGQGGWWFRTAGMPDSRRPRGRRLSTAVHTSCGARMCGDVAEPAGRPSTRMGLGWLNGAEQAAAAPTFMPHLSPAASNSGPIGVEM